MAVQVNFSLRTSANAETVHLLGSWDSYRGQLPLSREKAAKPGSWTGTFRFQQSMVQPGKRYWYYYIINGYHVSHDPAAEYTVEPTTKRKLNILDVPGKTSHQTSRQSQSSSRPMSCHEIVMGRGVSPSRIVHPRPSKPYASRQLREGYEYDLSAHLDGMRFSPNSSDSDHSSPMSSSPGSATFSSGTRSTSPSSLSELSDSSSGSSNCSCNRYGITQRGERVKIDCRGVRCSGRMAKRYSLDSGGSTPFEDSGSSCSSDSDEEYRMAAARVRRQGIAVRR